MQSHLHSAALKAKGLVVRNVGSQYRFDDHSIVMRGGHLSMATADQYIRVVGRHALPHVFHREDYIKLMKSIRTAAIAMCCEKLPANYPILMYSAAGGGGLGDCSGGWLRSGPLSMAQYGCVTNLPLPSCEWLAFSGVGTNVSARAGGLGGHRTCYRCHCGMFYADLCQAART